MHSKANSASHFLEYMDLSFFSRPVTKMREANKYYGKVDS